MPVGRIGAHLVAPYIVAHFLVLSAESVAQSATEPPQTPPESQDSSTSAPLSPEDDVTNHDYSHDEPLTTEQIEQSLGHTEGEGGNWADSSHEYVGTKADDLAIYLDRFFGSPIEDLESADSTIRFTTRFEWDDDEGRDVRFRLRGKVNLPRINERLALVFNEEDDDFSKGQQADEQSSQVGLQLNSAKTDRSRFDFTLGVSSGPNLKPGARYRFKEELGEWGRFRYTGRVDYSNNRRWRQRHTTELDYLTGETSLLRWSNRLAHGQRTEGVEWSSAISWQYGYSIDSAMSVNIGMEGVTEPDVPEFVQEDPIYEGLEWDQSALTTNYFVVLTFRNRLYKDWLFVEFEPGYTSRKSHHFEDRHGVFYGRINFEISFNRGREQNAKKESDSPAAEEAQAAEGQG